MKKTLLALAVLGAAQAACAQSSLTVFGVVDTGVQRIVNSGGGSITRVTNSGISVSQLGFRGVEDLGGGLAASFWIEAAINSENGSGRPTSTNNQAASGAPQQGLTFNRRSTVSLSGPWGEVRLGRDYNPSYWNLALYSPFSTLGVGGTMMSASIVTGATAGWTSNGIAYWLPQNSWGLYGQLQHWTGNNPSNAGVTADDGTGSGFRLGWRKGPFDATVAMARTQRGGPLGDIRQDNAGASWDFGAVKVMGVIGRDHGSVGTVAADGRSWSVGAIIPLGLGDLRIASSQYTTELATGTHPRSRKVAIGYRHNLSKSTALYTAFARIRNSGGAAAAVAAGGVAAENRPSSGIELGIRHSF